MQPILNNIVFKPLPSPEYTEGGLFIPESVREPNDKGIIVAVGNGSEKTPMRLKAGMVGYRVKGWGEEFIENGEIYYLMNEKAIIALESNGH